MLSRRLLGSSLVFFLSMAGTSFVQCEAPKEPAKEAVEEDTEAAPPGVTVPEGVRFEGDVDYLPRQDGKKRKHKADLYFPAKIASGTRVPAVIIIHGGGFNDGDKAKKREINIGTNLALNGYVGMSINYKLRKKPGQVTWPQPVLDAKMAVQWLRANAERLQIDPDRIGAIGGSAGGNLAMMLALTRPEDGLEPEGGPNAGLPTSVRCAVNLYGAVDLMNYHDMKMFNKTREEAPDLYKKASPLTYAHAGAPPILMIHGTADKVVKVSQSEALAAALNNVKAPNELIIIPDAPHTFDLESFTDLRPKVIGFFDKYLKAAP